MFRADEIEQEADALAQESLIPSASWDLAKITDATDVRSLANKLSISPCIIAGRVRYELKSHSKFGKAFRDKIRDHI